MENEEPKLKCDDCGDEIEKDEEHTIHGNDVCEDCFDKYITCENCNNLEHQDLCIIDNQIAICTDCYENHYFRCYNCETITNNVYASNSEDGTNYCQDCWENESSEQEPDNKRYITKGSKKMSFGVEIECENGNSNKLQEIAKLGCGIGEDGSLENGIEVQIPACNQYKTGYKLIETVCKELKDNGFEITNRCGIHVHINPRTKLTKFKKIFLTSFVAEPLLLAINPKSRQNNHYCQEIASDFDFNEIKAGTSKNIDRLFYSKKTDYNLMLLVKDIDKLTNKKHKRDIETRLNQLKGDRWNNARYYGFNLHSLFFRGTIEYRYHAGTLEPTKIINWIKLLMAIIKYAKSKDYSTKELEKINNLVRIHAKIKRLGTILKLDNELKAYIQERYKKFK